mmetsp:Transcript_1659/g.2813  ORF Transcript_1659/g.2813 Transcript_1659/m.2813 type:complete len:281 (+) Transcript_1659:31-873(+)
MAATFNHPSNERNQDATLFVGELESQVDEPLLWELFLQAGPVVNVYIPKDKVSGAHQGFGFVEFHAIHDADYALKLFNGVKIYGRPLRVNKSNRDRQAVDVGANLFIGNLDKDVDEATLHQTFSVFGNIVQPPKIMRDGDTGASRGFGFVSFDSFESADAAIMSLNNQYVGNRPITVSYAMKKDGKGERHGSEAERKLAARNPLLSTRQTRAAPTSFMPQQPAHFGMMSGGFGGAPNQAPMGLSGPMGLMMPQQGQFQPGMQQGFPGAPPGFPPGFQPPR